MRCPSGPGTTRSVGGGPGVSGGGAVGSAAPARSTLWAMFSRGLCELVLVVRDVAASARFYRDVVGLVPDGEADEAWAWFWAGEPGGRQRLAVTNRTLLFEEHSPHPRGRRFGQVHFALEVPRERLAAAVEHVRRHGVEVFGPMRFDWMKAEAYYFYDPDGNLVEFWSCDPGASPPAPPGICAPD